MKSSKTFCFRSNIPAWCQSSPYSPPPRRFGTAYTPPRSSQGMSVAENAGVTETLNPPYAYNSVRFCPSSASPFLWVMNIGTRVPSLLV
jgi:hypothetical protein